MKLDPVKLLRHRQQLGYSQKDVADKSNVSERTVQRAEAGISVSNENAAAIAAALQTKLQPLLMASSRGDDAPPAGKTVTLRRAASGRAILETLDQTAMGLIECEVEATSDNLDLLKNIAQLLEINMNDPMDEEKLTWPPRRTLAARLELIANFNAAIEQLESAGIGIFMSEVWLDAYLPDYDSRYERFYYPEDKKPVGCRAVRIVISDHGTDKVVRRAWARWPVSIHDDLDDEVPF